jgi:hypothetical protein
MNFIKNLQDKEFYSDINTFGMLLRTNIRVNRYKYLHLFYISPVISLCNNSSDWKKITILLQNYLQILITLSHNLPFGKKTAQILTLSILFTKIRKN